MISKIVLRRKINPMKMDLNLPNNPTINSSKNLNKFQRGSNITRLENQNRVSKSKSLKKISSKTRKSNSSIKKSHRSRKRKGMKRRRKKRYIKVSIKQIRKFYLKSNNC